VTDACGECGAPLEAGQACRDRFDFLLGRESADPALAAAHHLTVLCYSVQHPVLFDATAEGHAASRDLLREAVREHLPAAELRRRNRARLRQPDRPWLRNRGRAAAALPPAPSWTMTVADVVDGLDDGYAGRVWRWGAAMVADMARQAKPTGA
jgi:hypothetical protein